MNEDNFYFDRLPRFINILKQNLKYKLNKNNYLTIKDHIEIFCSFYEKNNVYHYFADLNIKADVMYIAIIRNEFENSIYIERKIRIEDDDEQYQIQLRLSFESLFVKNKIDISYEIKRDEDGNFLNQRSGKVYFSDYFNGVMSSSEIINAVNLYPISIMINLNADV